MREKGLVTATNQSEHAVDVVYIAVCGSDIRLARICIASVRYFYPKVPIRILAGGVIKQSILREFEYYSEVTVADIPAGEYGWGFVKLEPLFGPAGQRFLVLDSDTVLTGPVLRLWDSQEFAFLVTDDEVSEAGSKVHYHWEKVKQIDPAALPPKFLFNTGQWFGTAGLFSREDFTPWVEWSLPRLLRYPEAFMNGEQGLQNYVFNQKAHFDCLQVGSAALMVWPDRGMQGIAAKSIRDGTAPARIVHWAGLKKSMHRNMVACDLLNFFELEYYRRLPAGRVKMHYRRAFDVLVNQWYRSYSNWKKLFIAYKIIPLFRKCKSLMWRMRK